MLKIWGRQSSSNLQALMWCVGELNLAHDRIDAGLSYGVVNTPEYRAMNPNGTVPTLKDDDNSPLWETGAILRYLSNCYATEPFWPSDPVMRAEVDKWTEWSKINIALKFTAPIFWKVVRTPPSKQDPIAIRNAVEKLNPFLSIADSQLSNHSFLVGDELTLADIQFGHCLFRYFEIDIARKEHPHIRRYYDELTTRPAYRQHVMVSYDELREAD